MNLHPPAVLSTLSPALPWHGRKRSCKAAAAALCLCLLSLYGGQAAAASSEGCEGGGFTVLGLRGPVERTVAANALGSGNLIAVRGKYVEFDIDKRTFGILNYTLTGAPNRLDLTGGRRTRVFDSKRPDHRGLVLTSAVELELDGESLLILREGPGLTMKIQAKDCATGGVFQMEPERADQSRTRFTHVLSAEAFYFDNGNFRAREGDIVPYKDTTIEVPSRINFANNFSRKFVGRDSAQVAERVDEPRCSNAIRTRTGVETVLHCGRVSTWLVASGGRMGQVMGEDAVEVAPPATVCVRKCRAQNRVRGRAVVLGFPFPVPVEQQLKPPFP
ncbi:hypothetical protein [Massilia sp. Mn16-1_5]|uniref:hypothetical protein n=1 Tax=Massilia sp. Mn16-1_5 TaxID=2079199 RepID=UPI001E4BBE6F|nr:hypothetical protein [Massilia sp. Mn16-1_5]